MIKTRMLITCKEATLYIEKREENAITIKERIKLAIHLVICEFCKLFEKQDKFINLQLKHIHTEASLSFEEKEEMEKQIENILNGLN